MTILNIETSTNVCSVAISANGKCIFSRMNADGMNHATMLSPFIDEAFRFLAPNKPDAIAVSGGPGSYTGLRIGVSTAKGLSYGLEIPLIAIDTLEIMVLMAKDRIENQHKNSLLCAMIDARRMEVYAAFYDSKGKLLRKVSADIIDEDSYTDLLENNTIYFFGNGASKCKAVLMHSNAIFVDDIVPLAENMIPLAEKAFLEQRFADLAYYEPFYLKEFHTTAPKSLN
jgi:tRNA threonylcarbamoyladenosine biosynthesis protein TsaB